MYAIVKTGGKQYKVAPGDVIEVEKLDAQPGDKVELQNICFVDGNTVEADPGKAEACKVVGLVLDQFKDKKVIVFKFKKRKNYRRKRGHRQQLTRVRIESVGDEVAEPLPATPKESEEPEESEESAEQETTLENAE